MMSLLDGLLASPGGLPPFVIAGTRPSRPVLARVGLRLLATSTGFGRRTAAKMPADGCQGEAALGSCDTQRWWLS